MNTKNQPRFPHIPLGLLMLLSTINSPLSTLAQGTAFTYQGRLNFNGVPANGTYDLVFAIYASPIGTTGGFAVQTNAATPISNGLFTVTLNLGLPGIFTGPDRWLDISVRTNGGGLYSNLTPRQQLTPTPYSITAENVVSGGLAAGTYANAFTFNNPANSFCGDGGCLTNVSATTLGGLTSVDFWRLSGNTISASSFLGTLNNLPLEIKVNNNHALRIVPASIPSLEGGYVQNSTHGSSSAAIVGGGTSGSINEVFGNYGFIGAGHGAKVGGFSAVIDGAYNVALGQFSLVGTGVSNTNLADYAFIGSGFNNTIESNVLASVIGGGHYNTIQSNASWAIIGGGGYNIIQTNAYDSAIVGGGYNIIQPTAQGSIIGGGYANTNGSYGAVIGGGVNNAIQTGADDSAIGGGYQNVIQSNAFASFIGGGRGNLIQSNAFDSTIGGGPYNWILNNANASTIGGGYINSIQTSAGASTIGGGVGNIIQPNAIGSAICGGYYNSVQPNASASFIGGGTNNLIGTPHSVIGGGENNYVAGEYATVGGGGFNQATGRASFVGGGGGRDAGGGGPYGNIASGDWSTVGGGWFDVASGYSSTVGGGAINHATNAYATVAGGAFNVAGGLYSFAAGQEAYAVHQGSFVWADSQAAPFSSTNNDSFSVRAQGGVRFTSGAGGASQNVIWSPGSASWSFSSDRNLKEGFEKVDGASVLDKVAHLPISEWNYRGYSQRHIGPMAQDFHAQFPLNDSDTTLNDADLHGVALAAIQGLNQKVEEKDAEIQTLKQHNDSLEKRLDQMEALLKQLRNQK